MSDRNAASERDSPVLPLDFILPEGLTGIRLDAALSLAWPESGLRARRRLWTWCQIRVNGRTRPPGYIVRQGDTVRVEMAGGREPQASCRFQQGDAGSGSFCRDTSSGLLCATGQDQKSPAPSPKAAPSLFDDKLSHYQNAVQAGASGTAGEQVFPFTLAAVAEDYVALYKPADLHSAHIAGGSEQSLERLLPYAWPSLMAAYGQEHGTADPKPLQDDATTPAAGVGEAPLLLTRLDRATSGLVIAARSKDALENFRRWEREGRIEKDYFALVRGHVSGPLYLQNRLLTSDCSVTQVLEELDPDEIRHSYAEPLHHLALPRPWPEGLPATLLRVCIRRGARHQIRAHLARAGYPLAGERQYADPPPGDCPLYLHHAMIRFPGFSAKALPLDWPWYASTISLVRSDPPE